ncbi:MAG: hypothetical protein IPI19_00825 [Ignavibacteriales bacterium]|nr:hypothetical protein [Ignavibacteriales bacterium]
MIDSEEKFFSYLKGGMNSEKKKEFEEELLRSENLNKDFADYKKLHSMLDDVKNIRINKNYSESIITEFRKRKESRIINKSFSKTRFAFTSIVLILIGYFLISFLNQERSMEINSLLTEFSETELESLSRNTAYSVNVENNISDDDVSKIDSIYKENLSASLNETIEENRLDNIYSINNVSDIDEYLSENDVELIYAQLINKEIL